MLLGAIGVLFGLSIPWYRGADDPLRTLFGLPDWAAVALGCYVTIAVLNGAAWMLTEVPDAEPRRREDPG